MNTIRHLVVALRITTFAVTALQLLSPAFAENAAEQPQPPIVAPAPDLTAPAPSTAPDAPFHHVSKAIDYEGQRTQFSYQLNLTVSMLNNSTTNNYFRSKGFNQLDSTGAQNPDPLVSSIGLAFEYQPTFLQTFGVLSLGPTFALTPIFPTPNPFTSSIGSLFSFGAQIKYQFRYFRSQPLVPVVGYFVEDFFFHFGNQNNTNSDLQGSVLITGPMLGLWLYLNWLEPSAATSFFQNFGVCRSYLTFEVKSMTGNGGGMSISGLSYYGGLRFEI